jgi:hypothetical protein
MRFYLVLFLVVYAMLCGLTQNAVAAPANFSGTWETSWGGSKRASMLNVVQAGEKISGAYTYQGGKLSGVVEGNVATGTWWQADGARGAFRFVLGPRGNGFQGVWRNAAKKNWEGEWNGARR